MARQRHDMLVRRGTGVDDILGGLETLVVRRVPQQGVGFLEKRENFLSARRRVAPDHVPQALRLQQVPRSADVACKLAGRVDLDRNDRHGAVLLRIDLADR